METKILIIDKNNPEKDKLAYAADILQNGGLVAFPTETVYGIGANALDSDAVANIFKAKGRPSDNPLIVHIADKIDIDKLISIRPPVTDKLIDNFWPGPLTLIMPKSNIIPHIVTAGLDTVAVRMPSHPVAKALIALSGVPVAAPSANSSGKPSPTCAGHVIEDLYGKVDVIIDSGSVEVGLESTVLDITSPTPVILRPGGITFEQLDKLLGKVEIYTANKNSNTDQTPRSPGMKYKHYAPKAEVIVFDGRVEQVVEEINNLAQANEKKGIKTGIMATSETQHLYNTADVIAMGSRKNPETIALNLFYTLRCFDQRNVQVILAEAIENRGIGMAVMNRLIRAAGNNIIRLGPDLRSS